MATNMTPMNRRSLALLGVGCLLPASLPVLAHGPQDHVKPKGPVKAEQMDWGVAGNAKAARRTVTVQMLDTMRFTPNVVDVRLNETLRFNVINRGKMLHEFVIGTKAENAKHAELMIKFPTMEHDAPYMAHVAPGQRGQIIWTFNRPGEFEFACLIAGHYQSGMVGAIRVKA